MPVFTAKPFWLSGALEGWDWVKRENSDRTIRKQALIGLVKSRTVVFDQWIQEKLRVGNRDGRP